MKKVIERIAYSVSCPFVAALTSTAAVLSIASNTGLLGGKDKGHDDKAGAYYDQMANISKAEWDQWQTGGLPLLQSLGTQAQEDRTAQETERAAGQVKDQYAVARSNARRALNLQEGDQTERASAVLAPSYMDEASSVSQGITAARLAEQKRRFDETSGVVNVYRGFPQQATSGYGAAAAGEMNMSNMDSQRAAQGVYGGVVLANNARRWFGSGSPGAGGAVSQPGGITPGSDPMSAGGGYTPGSDPFQYKDGGEVGGGVIRGPGTGTSDSISARAKPGDFILSADTVRAIGHKKVHDLIEKAGVRPGSGSDYDGVPVRVSNGEARIPRSAVAYHGEDFFRKLQEKYHRPVMSEDGMANGGVVRKRGLPKSVEDAIYKVMPQRALGRA